MGKRKIIIGILTFAVIILGIIFLYPLPLGEIISNNEDLTIVYTENQIVDGNPKHKTTNYHYEVGSNEIEQIKQILSKHIYHRSIRSFSENNSMKGNDAGYWINIYSGESSIVLGGTGEIMVNAHVYRIGYWGNKKALLLIEEIRSVLN